MNYKLQKINESFYSLETDDINLKTKVATLLTREKKNIRYNVAIQGGWESPNELFFRMFEGKMILPVGSIPFLHSVGIQIPKITSDYTKEEILEFIDNLGLPFKLYDHQINAIVDSLINTKQICISCTGSGKSAIVSIISAFLNSKGLRGLILVPGIGLVTQIHADILDYNLTELHKSTHLIGGENNDKHFEKPLTISTWQSVRLFKEELKKIDYILVDEVQGAKGKETADIIQKCTNAKFKIGLTGTLPEEPIDRMHILMNLGAPVTYIKTQGLINLGLATPVNINIINLKYDPRCTEAFKRERGYAKQLKFIKDYDNRSEFIKSLSLLVSGKTGNTLTLFQHTEHGMDIFKKIAKERSGVEITNAHINGKNAFEFQKKYRVYFINGSVKATVREQIRLIQEMNDDSIIVANYSVMSTGINIKKIHNIIFASPLKSFVTITQSIGRGIRTHASKDVMNVYDLCDNFAPFRKQLKHRTSLSYEKEGFPIFNSDIII